MESSGPDCRCHLPPTAETHHKNAAKRSGFSDKCKACMCAAVKRSVDARKRKDAELAPLSIDAIEQTYEAAEALVRQIGPILALDYITAMWASRPAADAAFFTTGENA